MDLKEIITLAEVDRATFLKTVKIVRDKVSTTTVVLFISLFITTMV